MRQRPYSEATGSPDVWRRLPLPHCGKRYPERVTAAYDYSDLHRLIDRLQPEQAAEVKEYALRLVRDGVARFRVLRTFDGPPIDLGAQAKQLFRADNGEDDADR
jgi:hypothetical protein